MSGCAALEATDYIRATQAHVMLNAAVEQMLGERPAEPRAWLGTYFRDCALGQPPAKAAIRGEKEECQAWLKEHGVAEMVDDVTATLLKEQPAVAQVATQIARYFGAVFPDRKSSWASSSVDVEDVAPKVFCKDYISVPAHAGEAFSWCSCGRSQNQPFCDGTHRAVNAQYGSQFAPVRYEAARDGVIKFCGCRATGEPPICDYSHLSLEGGEGRQPVAFEFEPWVVVRTMKHNHDSVLLTLKMQSGGAGVAMDSTYHFSIKNDTSGKSRPYTPVHYNADEERGAVVVFLVKEVPDGAVSPWLCKLKEGDAVPIKGPSPGEFHYTPEVAGLTFLILAAGSGITPVYQLLQALHAKPQGNAVHFFYSNKSPADILVKDDLTRLLADLGGVVKSTTFAATRLPRGAAPPDGILAGRVTQEVVSGKVGDLGDLAKVRVVICGTPEFNRSMYHIASALQIAKEHVIFC